MKVILNIFLSLFTLLNLSNCAAKKQVLSFDEIKYEAITRGSNEFISIKNEVLNYTKNNISKSIQLTKNQLIKINEELSKINLEDIHNLKAPTNKRAYDGALSAKISIKKGDENYTSSTFDDSHPPKELEAICKILFECANQE